MTSVSLNPTPPLPPSPDEGETQLQRKAGGDNTAHGDSVITTITDEGGEQGFTTNDNLSADLTAYTEISGVLDNKAAFANSVEVMYALIRAGIELREAGKTLRFKAAERQLDLQMEAIEKKKNAAVTKFFVGLTTAAIQVGSGVYQMKTVLKANDIIKQGGLQASTQAMGLNNKAQSIGMLGGAASSAVSSAGEFGAGFFERDAMKLEAESQRVGQTYTQLNEIVAGADRLESSTASSVDGYIEKMQQTQMAIINKA